jgi:HD domain-containing protein
MPNLSPRSTAALRSAPVADLSAADPETEGHARRVSLLALAIGNKLGLPPRELAALGDAALLHDIGKLTVSPGILNKPGKLDEHEWVVMRQHPLEGARIATPLLAWLGPWAGAITEHHERFDGAGYPAGLSGGSISPAGRIVAVADAYDTMTAVRSYKKPMAVRAARQELVRCAGGQFDPAMVRAFLSISVPRLLWKTGPGSFLVQLPFLARLHEIGQQSIATAAQGVATATVVAGVSAATLAGSTSANPITHPRPRVIQAIERPAVAPSPSASFGGLNGADGGGPPISTPPSPGTTPRPTPSPEPRPSPTPSPSPSPEPSPTSDPAPLPSLSPLPLPSLPPPPPLPLPSPSLSGLGAEKADGPGE